MSGDDQHQPEDGAAITIGDVARAAGVSSATVSRVLNESATVASDKARRVVEAAEALGYRPYGPARALRQHRTRLLAVIVADVENPFFTAVVRGVEDRALVAAHRVLLCNSDGDLTKEAAYIDVALSEGVDGVIIAVADDRRSRLERLVEHQVPVVAIDRRPTAPPVDSVEVDNRGGAATATAHLLDAGWRRIACVTGPPSVGTADARLAGYRDALRAAGRSDDATLVRRSDFRRDGGYEATRSLLDAPTPPDALLVANNLMTLGALHAVRDSGRRIPDDIGIVGFDDAPWATLVHPPLTVVAQPATALGATATDLVLSSAAAPRHEVLSPTLVVRDSSRRCPPGTPTG